VNCTDEVYSVISLINLDRCLTIDQVGTMAHGKIDADYIDDLISGYS